MKTVRILVLGVSYVLSSPILANEASDALVISTMEKNECVATRAEISTAFLAKGLKAKDGAKSVRKLIKEGTILKEAVWALDAGFVCGGKATAILAARSVRSSALLLTALNENECSLGRVETNSLFESAGLTAADGVFAKRRLTKEGKGHRGDPFTLLSGDTCGQLGPQKVANRKVALANKLSDYLVANNCKSTFRKIRSGFKSERSLALNAALEHLAGKGAALKLPTDPVVWESKVEPNCKSD